MAPYIVFVIMVTWAVGIMLFRRSFLFYFLSAIILLQNLVAMLLLRSRIVAIEDGIVLLYIKEAIVILGLASLAFRMLVSERMPLSGVDRWALGLIFYSLSLLMVPSPASLLVKLGGLRNIVVLPCLYLIGRWLSFGMVPFASRGVLGRQVRFLWHLGLIMAATTLFERLVLPEGFWLGLGHEEYYLMKLGRPIQGSLFLNMYFWDFGRPLQRTASLTGDPLASAYTITSALLMVSSRLSTRSSVLRALAPTSILIIGLILTFGRGALLTLVIGSALVLLGNRIPRLQPLRLLGVSLCFVLAMTLPFVAGDVTVEKLSSHYSGLATGLGVVRNYPLGLGLGTSSNLVAGLLSRSRGAGLAAGGDSYIGSLLVQAGVPSLVLFFGFYLSLVAQLLNRGTRLRSRGWPEYAPYLAIAGFVAGVFATSPLNETGLSVVASGISFMLAGSLVSLYGTCVEAYERAEASLDAESRQRQPAEALCEGGYA